MELFTSFTTIRASGFSSFHMVTSSDRAPVESTPVARVRVIGSRRVNTYPAALDNIPALTAPARNDLLE